MSLIGCTNKLEERYEQEENEATNESLSAFFVSIVPNQETLFKQPQEQEKTFVFAVDSKVAIAKTNQIEHNKHFQQFCRAANAQGLKPILTSVANNSALEIDIERAPIKTALARLSKTISWKHS